MVFDFESNIGILSRISYCECKNKKGQFDDEDRKKGRPLKYAVDANRFLITFKKSNNKILHRWREEKGSLCHCGEVPFFYYIPSMVIIEC